MWEDMFDDPRLTAMGLLIEVYEGLTAQTNPVLAEHGLSGKEFDTLIRLARSPGRRLRMTDLAAQTSLTTSGVTRVVDRLEHDGLVYRQACPEDRRSLLAVLTDTGGQRLSALLPAHLANIERWFTGQLTPQQLDALLTGLHIVRAAIRPGAAAGAHG
ncbi:MAG: MarR family winged helix-turn-helix transcriptional regulator [Nocardioidaceae bacterium]